MPDEVPGIMNIWVIVAKLCVDSNVLCLFGISNCLEVHGGKLYTNKKNIAIISKLIDTEGLGAWPGSRL